MARDTVHVGGYLPLFAGSEIVRRSGALTQFPSDNLLGNLPPPPENNYLWYDSFTPVGPFQDLYNHEADVGPGTSRRYSVNVGLVYVELEGGVGPNGRVYGQYGVGAVTDSIPFASPTNWGRWTVNVYAPLDLIGQVDFRVYGGSQPWSGFTDPLARIIFDGTNTAQLVRGRYNTTSVENTLFVTPGSLIPITVEFELGERANTIVPGAGYVTTALPSNPNLFGEFVLTNTYLDELKLEPLIF